jgi:putative DNA primase/helicase
LATDKRTYALTDSGNAELFAALYGEQVRFDHKHRRWLIWDTTKVRWIEDKEGKVRQMMKASARERHRRALDLPDENRRKNEIDWALKSESVYGINSALKLATSETPISDSGEGWDCDPWLLGMANGIVDLQTGKLRPATPKDRISKFSPVRFDAAAKCLRFQQFISEVFGSDGDLVRYLQKAVGYSFTGSVQEQCFFACYGEGSNGKTTLLEVLAYVAGDYGASVPFHALEVKHSGGVPNESLLLLGKRFVKSSETREGRRLDEGRVKAWTGGDSMMARPLYREYFTFSPTHKLWLAFNHKPVIADDSPAMWRRVHMIPFEHKFEGAQVDALLGNKLRAEAPGILNWAIEGCIAWQREGLQRPTAVQQATREYEQESDALGPFLEDHCIVDLDNLDSSNCVPASHLWDAYLDWAKVNGESPMARNTWADRLKRRGFRSMEAGHEKRRVWRGLTLRPKDEVADARRRAGADSQDSSNRLSIEKGSLNGHPQAPAPASGSVAETSADKKRAISGAEDREDKGAGPMNNSSHSEMRQEELAKLRATRPFINEDGSVNLFDPRFYGLKSWDDIPSLQPQSRRRRKI